MAIQEMDYNIITESCINLFRCGERDPLRVLTTLMDCAGVPMHDPVHHYIMPATLLALACAANGEDAADLRARLAVAEERARKLLPGFCGWWGACGAAVGCGVFASVWLGTSPKKEANWATINTFTAKCLTRVASVNGPRCCKRTSFLALGAALENAAMLGLDLGAAEQPVCGWSAFNAECRKEGCPFYEKEAGDKGQR